jgi:hypothetical protein
MRQLAALQKDIIKAKQLTAAAASAVPAAANEID